MDLNVVMRAVVEGRLPRTRGDGPSRIDAAFATVSAPPHTRGWTPPPPPPPPARHPGPVRSDLRFAEGASSPQRRRSCVRQALTTPLPRLAATRLPSTDAPAARFRQLQRAFETETMRRYHGSLGTSRREVYGSGYQQARGDACARSGDRCQFCGRRGPLEGHHFGLRYPVDHEVTAADLTALCLRCHLLATTVRLVDRLGLGFVLFIRLPR